jgi:galactokinase
MCVSDGAGRAALIADLRQRFHTFAGRAGLISFAPGRINLIGEHTDYSSGFVLPASLAIGTWVASAPREDRIVRVFSENQQEVVEFPVDTEPSQARQHWSDYIAGVIWALQGTDRRLHGVDLFVRSDVPLGAGLSSSAALEVSAAYAVLSAAGASMTPLEIAQTCQRAENEFVGARCGIMDQFIATHGKANHALLLDCASYDWRSVPLPVAHRWIIANTMVRHALAHGEYNVRRAECEHVVSLARRRLPNRSRLADLDAAEERQLAGELPSHLARRLRHIVAENRRVLGAVRALEVGDVATLGRLLVDSHSSLRANYEVSCKELDVMVDLALGLPGVVGARMIGGGFGGCTLTLVEEQHACTVLTQLQSQYLQATGIEPSLYICSFGDAGGALS